MRAARIALIAVGAVGTVIGAWLAVTTNRPAGVVGLLIWLAAAVILHDAIFAPVLFAAGWLLRLTGRRLPLAALAVVQVAAIVGGIGSLILLPAIHAKQLGPRNPSVLPLDYVANLAGMWAVLAVATVVGVTIVVVHQRRTPGAGSV